MRIALLGNPNTGKTSVFNLLTGLRQQVGNFPGVTVDKKVGKLDIHGENHELVDFPGTYSFYPRSGDERVVFEILSEPKSELYPDVVAVVVDASNLERNLLLFSQVYDLQLPTVMILNMTDLAAKQHRRYDVDGLRKMFPEATIVESNARVKTGKSRIKNSFAELKERRGDLFLEGELLNDSDLEGQEKDAERRFAKIASSLKKIETAQEEKVSPTSKIDRVLVHPVFGYLIFALILMLIFQFIYAFAAIPMDFIDGTFATFSSWTASVMPEGIFTDLLTKGIIPGIGGVVIFIPQIALLFFFIAILEETGYLSRVVFIMDRLMRPLGLNGKSIVPLISSVACAIPGVMAARTISDRKERIITIMVAPLMSCSARIPVYTLLIAIVIPSKVIGGFMNLQGLVLFGLYALGTISALVVALVLKWVIKTKEKGFLMLEMPSYKAPRWGNVGLTVLEKVKIFVWDAGRVILAISIILWALATYGPGDKLENAEKMARKQAVEQELSESESSQLIASMRLEKSYIGIMGKSIEPVIEPLGYDWKIGISVITSFAAREVFVGSMATIYAVGDDGEENLPLIEKMKQAKRADGSPIYTLAAGASLMVFFAFAMQCMSTLAVVKRETRSWKWPLLQLGYMGVLAYLGAWITFIILS
ncbi:MAG: ferrous iron transporter B [Crocinitomicaceae bacterium]|nr:ferrous iron transporter B [Crocinitomicaceae bacterium]MDG1658179.1 ferrous iron transporter B [Crocinitomicaceae bacterium]MDG2441032.1 ferrous iron transporter B [Crocinitomicaceae bacterium]